eukprot:5324015-Amphidinium_carterae.1
MRRNGTKVMKYFASNVHVMIGIATMMVHWFDCPHEKYTRENPYITNYTMILFWGCYALNTLPVLDVGHRSKPHLRRCLGSS